MGRSGLRGKRWRTEVRRRRGDAERESETTRRGAERQPPEDKPINAEGRMLTRAGDGAKACLTSQKAEAPEREANGETREGRRDARRMRGLEADAGTRADGGTRGEQRDADGQRGHERLRAVLKRRHTFKKADAPEGGVRRRLRPNHPKTNKAPRGRAGRDAYRRGMRGKRGMRGHGSFARAAGGVLGRNERKFDEFLVCAGKFVTL